jgi:hypothetical protein
VLYNSDLYCFKSESTGRELLSAPIRTKSPCTQEQVAKVMTLFSHRRAAGPAMNSIQAIQRGYKKEGIEIYV